METERDLEEQLRSLLEEARMVIPGVQALMGFQLVVVFNPLFPKSLDASQQHQHFISLICTTLAMVLIMSPASYHRISNHSISEQLVRLSSAFLLGGMFALSVGICVDIQLIAYVVFESECLSVVLTLAIAFVFAMQWFVLPMLWSKKTQ